MCNKKFTKKIIKIFADFVNNIQYQIVTFKAYNEKVKS